MARTLRYWDGSSWTEDRAPDTSASSLSTPARSTSRLSYRQRYRARFRVTGSVMAGLTVLAVLLNPVFDKTTPTVIVDLLVAALVGFFMWGSVVNLVVALPEKRRQ